MEAKSSSQMGYFWRFFYPMLANCVHTKTMFVHVSDREIFFSLTCGKFAAECHWNSKNSQNVQNLGFLEKNFKIATLYQSTYQRPSVPWNPLYFYRQFSGRHKAPFTFLFVQPDGMFEESTNVKETYFWQFSAINSRQKFAHSRNSHQHSLLYALLKLFLHSGDIHPSQAFRESLTLSNARTQM